MYWNILDKDRKKLLKSIIETLTLDNYYMIGGTSLSLQLGLRESFDFDFCVKEYFNNELIIEELNKIGQIEILQNQKGTCDILVNGVQISFFYYPNKVVEEFVTCEEIPNLKLASILDIAAMKLVAIGRKRVKKRFF